MINLYLTRLKFFGTTRLVVLFGQPLDAPTADAVRANEDTHCLRCIINDIDKVVTSIFNEFSRVCIKDPGLSGELLDLIRPRGERTYLYTKLIFDYLDVKMEEWTASCSS